MQRSHHSIIPLWIYRIPSELRSQARLGPISTAVGDHAGILGVECFFFPPKNRQKRPATGVNHAKSCTGLIIRSHHRGYTASHPNCEVKHGWAQSVLRWGTTRESWVSNVFLASKKNFGQKKNWRNQKKFEKKKICEIFCEEPEFFARSQNFGTFPFPILGRKTKTLHFF